MIRLSSVRARSIVGVSVLVLSATACTSDKAAPTTTTTVATTTSTTAATTTTTLPTTTTTSAPAKLSHAETVAEVNQICTSLNTALKPIPDPTTLEIALKSIPQVIDLSNRASKSIKDLDAGSADIAEVNLFLKDFDAGTATLAEVVTAAKAGDQAAFEKALATYADDITQFTASAKVAGFTECGLSSKSSTPATPANFVDLSTTLKPVFGFTYSAVPKQSLDVMTSGFAGLTGVGGVVTSLGSAVATTNDGSFAVVFVLSFDKAAASPEVLRTAVKAFSSAGTNVKVANYGDVEGVSMSLSGQYFWFGFHNANVIYVVGQNPVVSESFTKAVLAANPDL